MFSLSYLKVSWQSDGTPEPLSVYFLQTMTLFSVTTQLPSRSGMSMALYCHLLLTSHSHISLYPNCVLFDKKIYSETGAVWWSCLFKSFCFLLEFSWYWNFWRQISSLEDCPLIWVIWHFLMIRFSYASWAGKWRKWC